MEMDVSDQRLWSSMSHAMSLDPSLPPTLPRDHRMRPVPVPPGAEGLVPSSTPPLGGGSGRARGYPPTVSCAGANTEREGERERETETEGEEKEDKRGDQEEPEREPGGAGTGRWTAAAMSRSGGSSSPPS